MKGAFALLYAFLVVHDVACSTASTLTVDKRTGQTTAILPRDSENGNKKIDVMLTKRSPNSQVSHAATEAVTHAAKPLSPAVKNVLKIGGGFAAGLGTMLGIRKAHSAAKGPDPAASAPPADPVMMKRSPNVASEVTEAISKPAVHAISKPGTSKALKNVLKMGGGFGAGVTMGALIRKRGFEIDVEEVADDDVAKRARPELIVVEEVAEKAVEPVAIHLSEPVKNVLKVGGSASVGAGLAYALDEAYSGRRNGLPDEEETMIKRSPQASQLSHTIEQAIKPASKASKHLKNALKIGGGAAIGAGTMFAGTKIASARKSQQANVMIADEPMPVKRSPLPNGAAQGAAKTVKPWLKNPRVLKNSLKVAVGTVLGATGMHAIHSARTSHKAVSEPAAAAPPAAPAATGSGADAGSEPMMLRKRATPAVTEETISTVAQPIIKKGFNTFEKVGAGFLAGSATTLVGTHIHDKLKEVYPSHPSAVYVYHDTEFVKRYSMPLGEANQVAKRGGKHAAALYGLAAGVVGGGVAGWQLNEAKNRMVSTAVQRGRDEAGGGAGAPMPARRSSLDDVSEAPMSKRGLLTAQELSPVIKHGKEFFKTSTGKKVAFGAAVGGAAAFGHHIGSQTGHAQGYGEGLSHALNGGATGETAVQKRGLPAGEAGSSVVKSLLHSASSSSLASETIKHGAKQGIKIAGKTFRPKTVAIAGGSAAAGATAFGLGVHHGRNSKSSTPDLAAQQNNGGSNGSGSSGMYKRDLGQVERHDVLEKRQKGLSGNMNSALLAAGASGLTLGGALIGHELGKMSGKVQALERRPGGSGGYYKRELSQDESTLMEKRGAGGIAGSMNTALLASGAAGLALGGGLIGHHVGTLKGKVSAMQPRTGGQVYKRSLRKRGELPTKAATAIEGKMGTALIAAGSAGLALGGYFTGNKVGFMRGKVEGMQKSRNGGSVYYKRSIVDDEEVNADMLAKREPTVEKGIANTLKGAGVVTGLAGLAVAGHHFGKHFAAKPKAVPAAPSMAGSSGMDIGSGGGGSGYRKRDLRTTNRTPSLKPAVSLYKRSPEPVVKEVLAGGALYAVGRHYGKKRAEKKAQKKYDRLMRAHQEDELQYGSSGLPPPVAPPGVKQQAGSRSMLEANTANPKLVAGTSDTGSG